jgi:hypothetical protein
VLYIFLHSLPYYSFIISPADAVAFAAVQPWNPTAAAYPPYLLQQMPSLLQQSIRNGTFHPVTQQQSIQEQPLRSIPQRSIQDTEMQLKAVADQFEKKGVDPVDHFHCPQVVDNSDNCATTPINQPTAVNKKAVASYDSNKGAATIDQTVASNNDKPTRADATKEMAATMVLQLSIS